MTQITTQGAKIQIVEHSVGKKAKVGGLPAIMHIVVNRYEPPIKAGEAVKDTDKISNRIVAYGKAYDAVMTAITGTEHKTDIKTCSAAIGVKLLDVVSSPDVVRMIVEALTPEKPKHK